MIIKKLLESVLKNKRLKYIKLTNSFFIIFLNSFYSKDGSSFHRNIYPENCSHNYLQDPKLEINLTLSKIS